MEGGVRAGVEEDAVFACCRLGSWGVSYGGIVCLFILYGCIGEWM